MLTEIEANNPSDQALEFVAKIRELAQGECADADDVQEMLGYADAISEVVAENQRLRELVGGPK